MTADMAGRYTSPRVVGTRREATNFWPNLLGLLLEAHTLSLPP